ncbi:protein-L-isoaspartate O-methyltransferase family protein [Aquibium oceanicum]|uniref:Protein-L-isoaspartate O-methyltransferase n=1 Tax=Aquibium oceanicum TaxID=1670800 RepID=A0A1L3SRK1_9HYPH|nr:SAM-dependent methyltransferase [Aquibium oceanicum]APH72034.1 SAM-dependent methyltransferase [Aquibium oceanicum]
MAGLAQMQALYARMMAAHSGSTDPRLERAFSIVPREAFLPPGPWTIMANGRRVETPSADPSLLYQNVLVALNRTKGINNGEPFLHAAWIGRVAPQPGEIVSHIGAGTGYYSAILSMLVLPTGKVHAYEIEPDLADQARENLEPFENVEVHACDASAAELPASDVIYVNAGVAAPPTGWMQALRPGARMIFPWRPSADVALAMLVTRTEAGFACLPFMRAWFIACVGASDTASARRLPTAEEAWRTRSVWLHGERQPDETATAVFDHLWFSSAPPKRQDAVA